MEIESMTSKLVICGSFDKYNHKRISTTNMDAPLLRLLLSQTASAMNTLTSVVFTSAYLTTEIEDDGIVLVMPPPNLIKMGVLEANAIWRVRKCARGAFELSEQLTWGPLQRKLWHYYFVV